MKIFGVFSLREDMPAMAEIADFIRDSDYSDPDVIELLKTEAGAAQFTELKFKEPRDAVLINNPFLPNNATGMCSLFADPRYPTDPEYGLALYFVAQSDAKGGMSTKFHRALAGPKAGFIMLYREPCCEEISIVIHEKDKGLVIKDGMQGTHDGHRLKFFMKQENGDLMLDGNGKPIPLVFRLPSDAEFMELKREGHDVGEVNPLEDLAHRFVHALGVEHDCSNSHERVAQIAAPLAPKGLGPR